MLGVFGNVSLLHETRCKIGWTGAINGQVCDMKSHRKFFATKEPDPPHWTLNSWFGAFHSVWVHFGLFRYCTKVDAMRAEMVELMHKFVPWSRVRIFQNERTRLNPKLMFWCVLLCSGAFGNVSLRIETRCKTVWNGAIKAQVCATKSHQKFSLLTHPIPLIGIKTHVLVRFVLFGCILDCFVTAQKSMQSGLKW